MGMRRGALISTLALGCSFILQIEALLQARQARSTHWTMCSMELVKDDRDPIILGSKSSTRKMILEELGFKPQVRVADINEAAIGNRDSDPRDLVLQLGRAKATTLLPGLQSEIKEDILGCRLLLTGDQVVVHEGRILEKPRTEGEVRRNIAGYARKAEGLGDITDPGLRFWARFGPKLDNTLLKMGRRSPCRTVGSVVLTDIVTGRQVSDVDTAEIFFAEIPEHVVGELCREGLVMHCAGGLMVEHELVAPYVTRIDGTIDSVMGLSKPLVLKLLDRLRVEVKDDVS